MGWLRGHANLGRAAMVSSARVPTTTWRDTFVRRVAPLLAALALGASATGGADAPHQRSGRPPALAEAPPAPGPPATPPAPVPGARDLREDERRGGHTLERHVGKTDAQLRARLQRDRRISAASTYTDLPTAERVVGETLDRARRRGGRWAGRTGRRPNLALDFDGDPRVVIGRSLRRGEAAAEDCHDAVVVLRWDEASGDYFVLTSYPEVRR